MARRGQIATADQNANLQQAQVQQAGGTMAQQLLNHSFGSTNAYDQGGSNSGSSTAAGSAVGGALGGGLSGLASMMAMMAMLNGNGGGSGGSGGGY